MDFSGFLSEFAAGVAAGALVLYVGYRFVEQRLRLQERAERVQEVEAQRKQNLEAVLQAVHSELESNAAQLTTALKELPKGGSPYPLFDVAMRPVVSEPVVFTTLQRETVQALTHVYNRMTTANEQHAFLSDLNHGPTAILATSGPSGSLREEAYHRFVAHRDAFRLGLIDRLNDLKPHLDAAIDAVEAELGISRDQPAAQRIYQPNTPVGLIEDPRRLPPLGGHPEQSSSR